MGQDAINKAPIFFIFLRMEGEKMEGKGIRGKTAFMAALFVASAFVLGLKLLNPTPIQIVIEGQSTSITQLPGFFTVEDVMIIVIASVILGVSGTYLLFLDLAEKSAGELVLEERKKRWKEIAKTLKEDEIREFVNEKIESVFRHLRPEDFEELRKIAKVEEEIKKLKDEMLKVLTELDAYEILPGACKYIENVQ